MSAERYLLLVSAVLAGSLAVVWPALASAGGAAQRAAAFGGLLAWANTAAAYALARWAAGRSPNVFLGAVLGGMVTRMGVVLGAVVAGILLLDMPRLPLAISVLAYFLAFLAIELTLLHRQGTQREA
jgi:hypothetical protein